MKLTAYIQEALLALLCYDDKHGGTTAALVQARHFDVVYADVAELAIEYRERHKQAPGVHTIDLFEAAAQADPQHEELFERLQSSVEQCAEEINPLYILEQAQVFVRRQELKRALGIALREMERDDEEGLVNAEAALAKGLERAAELFHPGTKFIEDIPATLAFLEAWEEGLPTGIPALDLRGLGPAPGRLHLFVAPPKAGKSWWMVNLATRSRQHAKRVLYVSLELSEAEIAQRLVQSFFSMSKRHVRRVRFRKFKKTKHAKDSGTQWDWSSISSIPHLSEEGIREKLVERFKVHADGERLIIRTFPTGTLSLGQLEGFLDFLESKERFTPELLIVDYADIMKIPDSSSRWEGLIELTQGLRRIAQERHVAVATASQTTVKGATARRTEAHHTAGAWDKIATADTVITFSQTEAEKEDNAARLFVAAARTDEDRFEVMLSQSYSVGQFVLDSTRLGANFFKPEGTD